MPLASYQRMNSYLYALSSETIDHFHFYIHLVFAPVIMLSTYHDFVVIMSVRSCVYFAKSHFAAALLCRTDVGLTSNSRTISKQLVLLVLSIFRSSFCGMILVSQEYIILILMMLIQLLSF